MAHWINESIVIGLPLTDQMKELIEYCEQLNKKADYAFFWYADTLSNVCNWAVPQGRRGRRDTKGIPEGHTKGTPYGCAFGAPLSAGKNNG